MEASWRKMSFWKKKPLTEGVDYEFYHVENSTLTGIRLLKGEYKDICYYYGQVKVQEHGEVATLNFDFKSLYSPVLTDEQLQSEEKFVTLIGDILMQILIDKVATHEQIRKDDSPELDV